MSGKPLAELSEKTLRTALQILGKRRENLLIVSAGGVLTPEIVYSRIKMGADLVQTYSGLVFQGPGFFQQVAEAAKDFK